MAPQYITNLKKKKLSVFKGKLNRNTAWRKYGWVTTKLGDFYLLLMFVLSRRNNKLSGGRANIIYYKYKYGCGEED